VATHLEDENEDFKLKPSFFFWIWKKEGFLLFIDAKESE
jgi:hypothetical protein